MIFIKPLHNNWACCINWQVIFQLLESSMRVGTASVRRMRMRRARVKRVMRVSLSHSQRDFVAQEVSVMHQVLYSSSVSTFCRNEIKDRNYKSVQQHIFLSFIFQEEHGWQLLCSMSFSLEIFHRPLNHSREKE